MSESELSELSELTQLVRLHTQRSVSLATTQAIEAMAELLVRELLKQPGVRERLTALVTEAFDQSWREMTRERPTGREG